VLARLPSPGGNGLIIRTAGAGAARSPFVRDLCARWRSVAKDVEKGMREKPSPCRLYQEPDLIERVVRDSLTEDIDRIVVDNRRSTTASADMVAKFLPALPQSHPALRRRRAHLRALRHRAPAGERVQPQGVAEGGGYLIFDETEALVAIDVNTGRHKGGKNQEESIVQVNWSPPRRSPASLRCATSAAWWSSTSST
jgi:ribonuclease G